jgi:cholesterol transport system auxiliary component
MSRYRTNAFLCFTLILSAAAMTGCAQTSPGKEFFMLEAVRPAGAVQTPSNATLEVRLLNVDTAFASKNLVYRLGEFQYETDSYRQFLVSPAQMLTERTRRWLSDSGLFKQVLPSSSQVTPMYTLQGIVTSLYGDFTSASAPTAVMRIRFLLVRHERAEGSIVFSQAYRVTQPLSAKTAEALLDALSKDLTEILTRLEEDMRKHLAKQSDKP